jgi:hypothetical protein
MLFPQTFRESKIVLFVCFSLLIIIYIYLKKEAYQIHENWKGLDAGPEAGPRVMRAKNFPSFFFFFFFLLLRQREIEDFKMTTCGKLLMQQFITQLSKEFSRSMKWGCKMALSAKPIIVAHDNNLWISKRHLKSCN